VVTLRTVLIGQAVTLILATAGGAAASAYLIERGAPGPRGATGAQGKTGAPGTVDAEDVMAAIEADPARVAQAIQDELDPTPADLQDQIDTVSGDLSTLCTDLQAEPALASASFNCP
jgi:hypothetical protein